MKKYDLSQHYHIGYYEDGYDLEVTAYKRINESVDEYGIMVYSFSNDMDEEEARIVFEKWLKKSGIV